MSNVGLLDGYLTREELARELNCSERTVARYEFLPNGLPYCMLGGRKLYRIESVRAWLAGREQRPNPSRTRAA